MAQWSQVVVVEEVETDGLVGEAEADWLVGEAVVAMVGRQQV